MAQPRDYTRQYNFNDFQTTSPSSPLPGNEVDNELNSVKLTLDDLNENIEKIQRDDGKLKNQAVHKDAFDAGALALINADSFNPRGDWATATTYAVNDLVDFNGATYLATTAHTASAAFGTDLNADRWILLANAAIATTAAAVDKYEGDGNTTAFTLQYNYAADTSALVFVNGALRNPGDDYSIVGNQITFTTAPSLPAVAGNENVIVWGASVVAQAAKEAAEAAESNASGFADEAEDWASQTTGIVESTDYSAKAYAIGGTGVDTGDGSAKDWAIKTSGTVGNTGDYSAKYWATNTSVTTVSSNIGDIQTVAGEITPTNNVSTVAGIASDVTAVAADATDIGVVSSNISDVNSVAGVSTDISSLNAIKTDITTVSGIQANVTTVAGISTQTSTVAGIASDVTGVNAISAAVTGVNNISSDVTAVSSNNANVTTVATDLGGSNTIGTVASSISSVNNVSSISAAVSGVDAISGDVSTVSGISANVTTVANNLADVNNFADTYFIGATAPASPTVGDLWFDTTSNSMKVYGSSGFQAAGSSVNGTAQRNSYTATAGQTSFAATYDAGYVDVYLNGVKLIDGSDFTATNGTSVVLSSGAAAGDTVDIVGYGTFQLSNFSINDANDVNAAGATTGQFLKYDGTNWVGDNVTIPSTDLVNDTTPQLGGNLDLNSNNITGTGNIDIAGNVTIDNVSGGNFLTLHSTTAGNQEMQIEYDHTDVNSFGGNGVVTFTHIASGTEDTATVRANNFSADTYRVGGTKTKPMFQIRAIDSSTATVINNTSWNAITGTDQSLTITKDNTLRQYFVTIPGEIDSNAGNVFARVYRSVNGGGYSAFSSITNLNFPAGVTNGTVNSTVQVIDTTSYAAGTTVAYRVYVMVQNSSASLELGQNNLSGNSGGNNHIQGFLSEYDHS